MVSEICLIVDVRNLVVKMLFQTVCLNIKPPGKYGEHFYVQIQITNNNTSQYIINNMSFRVARLRATDGFAVYFLNSHLVLYWDHRF